MTVKIQALVILTFMTFGFCQGQKLNKIYYGVSSDSLYNGHQLEFKTDTTLEISTFPRHMSRQYKITFNYKRKGKAIKIVDNGLLQGDSIDLANHRLTQFINGTTFSIDKKAIVDTLAKMVYVLYSDFSKRYYLTYIIDGKTYKQETGLSDSYGLIKNNSKENKALTEKLASMDINLDNHTINVYKGLDAYKKFGYDCVFGVIELTEKH